MNNDTKTFIAAASSSISSAQANIVDSLTDGDALATAHLAQALKRLVVAQRDVESALSCLQHTLPFPDSPALELIKNERLRQKTEEGWTEEHDNQYVKGELHEAAMVYMNTDADGKVSNVGFNRWPWAEEWFKPTTILRNLEKAGALLMAERELRVRRGSNAIDQVDSLIREVISRIEAIQSQVNFVPGDLVNYAASRRYLRSGASTYPFAVVAKVHPLVLVSTRGDMRWSTNLVHTDFAKVGIADKEAILAVNDRMSRDDPKFVPIPVPA